MKDERIPLSVCLNADTCTAILGLCFFAFRSSITEKRFLLSMEFLRSTWTYGEFYSWEIEVSSHD
jgi:hypothetical protein